MAEKFIKAAECYEIVKELFFPTAPEFSELTMSQYAWMKIQSYIRLVGDLEITGFGKIENNTITDVVILKQKVAGTTCSIDEDEMFKFLMSIPDDERGCWKLDWHSHANMGCFYSGTDTKNYEEQWEARLRSQFPVMVVNQKGDYIIHQYISPSRQTDIQLNFEEGKLTENDLKSIYEECRKDVEESCFKVVYTKPKTNYNLTKQDKKQGYVQVTLDDYCEECGAYLWSPFEKRTGYCLECWGNIPSAEKSGLMSERNIKQ